MKVTGVRVEFRKTLSDGRYGNETVVAQYIAELDEGEDPDEAIRGLAARGRAHVIGELKESESESIRWKLEPPKPAVAALTEGEICPDCGYARSACVCGDDGF